MAHNRSQLINALYREYEFLCHDDFDPDVDCTPAEYLDMLNTLSDDKLVAEASDDDIDEFIAAWSCRYVKRVSKAYGRLKQSAEAETNETRRQAAH